MSTETNEYLQEAFVDDEDIANFGDAYPALQKTTLRKPEFDLSATQTLPKSYKLKTSDVKSTIGTKFSPNFRSQSVGELSIENREMGRVQLVVSSDSFVTSTLPRPPKPVRSVLTVQEKLTQDIPSLPPQVRLI